VGFSVKLLVSALLGFFALSIAAFAPVSSNQCRAMHDQVMQPLRNVIELLQANPDLNSLSAPQGCYAILQQFKTLPQGAEIIRQIATRDVENTSSKCLYPVTSVQYECAEGRCLPQAFSYCGQWAYSMTNQPHYELGIELAYKIDNAYDKAQQLCGHVFRWDETGALTAAHELLNYLDNQVQIRSEKLYGMACGN
jgi:hypothetical protein